MKINKLIKLIFNNIGITLLKKRMYEKILNQRNNALLNLSKIERKNRKGIVAIIFSKDRAMQLYLLIESIQLNIKGLSELYIIYNISNEENRISYQILKDLCKEIDYIKFIKEDNFRDTLIKLLNKIEYDKLMFLVDDNVIIQRINLSSFNDVYLNNMIVSLRLGINIEYSYTTDEKIKRPDFSQTYFINNFIEFSWTKGTGEWADPCSLDGNIYETSLIQAITSLISFKAPNSYESELKNFDTIFFASNALCMPIPILKNIAVNRVQNEFKNRSGEISHEYLNEKWRNGFKIDLKSLNDLKTFNSTHLLTEFKYIER
jgi:hypothetical protein